MVERYGHRSIIDEPKPIRTIFIDITATEKKEAYCLLEVRFNEELFDEVEVVSTCEYVKYYLKQPIMQTVICLSLACDDRMK
ncbi:hypothetical protein [Sulfurovum sp.]|uniref:hypothetical protein n=1 Tax=Sulfurovum sp. TaxID=1969726 RepID=UPI0025D7C451|nr:hypothetical protein [Sulfurovum sp.]